MTVVVPSFGDTSWSDLALTRAVPSARALGVPVLHHHGDTLHEARNALVDVVDTEWVCHLDADDELEAGYFAAMAAADGDVRAPAVRYVQRGHAARPRMPRVAGHQHDCDASCLVHGNWLVVGALVRTQLVRDVGGWRDFDWSEDWDLWLRCHLAGASIAAIPEAVYRAHVRRGSRNRTPDRSARLAAHQAIARANGIAA